MSFLTIILVAVVFVILAAGARQMRIPYAVPILTGVFVIYVVFELFSINGTEEEVTSPRMIESLAEAEQPAAEAEAVEKAAEEDIDAEADEEELKPEEAAVEEMVEEEVKAETEAVSVEDEESEPPIVLRKFLICRDVDEKAREVIRPAEEFPDDVGKLFCFTAVKLDAVRDTVIHVWYYNNREINRIPIEVLRGNFYRVWSWKTIASEWTGEWYVSVIDSKGEELGRKEFRIIPVLEEVPTVTDTLRDETE